MKECIVCSEKIDETNEKFGRIIFEPFVSFKEFVLFRKNKYKNMGYAHERCVKVYLNIDVKK